MWIVSASPDLPERKGITHRSRFICACLTFAVFAVQWCWLPNRSRLARCAAPSPTHKRLCWALPPPLRSSNCSRNSDSRLSLPLVFLLHQRQRAARRTAPSRARLLCPALAASLLRCPNRARFGYGHCLVLFQLRLTSSLSSQTLSPHSGQLVLPQQSSQQQQSPAASPLAPGTFRRLAMR